MKTSTTKKARRLCSLLAGLVICSGLTAQNFVIENGEDIPVKIQGVSPKGLVVNQPKYVLDRESLPTVKNENSELTTILIEEDFRNMPAGTEDEPDSEHITEGYFSGNPYIDPVYTQTPGWSGGGIFQAGGACAINYPSLGGFLNTPEGDYSGKLTITFRAKNISKKEKTSFMLSIGKFGVFYPTLVAEDAMMVVSLQKSEGWTDVTIEYENKYSGTDGFIQFNVPYTQVMVDDIKILSEATFMPAPVVNDPVDFTPEGFTLSWLPIRKATDYILNVTEERPTSIEESIEYQETFDGLNINGNSFDETNPNIPDGWILNVTQDGPKHVFTQNDDCISAPYSICLNSDMDTIETPDNGGLLLKMEMKCKFVKKDNSNAILRWDGWDGYKWKLIASLYLDEYISEGETVVANLTSGVKNKHYKTRLRCENFGETEVAIDNVVYTTTTPKDRIVAINDKAISDTFEIVTGMDPYAEYKYYVKARNTDADMISDADVKFNYIYGLCKPEVLQAKDIDDRGGYTACWNAVPKAQKYEVNNYEVFTATQDISGYNIIGEDFIKILNNASYDAPIYLGNDYMPLDEYTQRIGWHGRNNIIADASIGCEYDQFEAIPSYLESPQLSLGGNDGKYSVTITAKGSLGDVLYIINNSGYTASLDLTGNVDSKMIEMTGGQEKDVLLFQSLYGRRFLIDEIIINQDIKNGDEVVALTQKETIQAEENTTCRFSGLEKKDNVVFAYDLTALYTRANNSYSSPLSDRTLVSLSSGLQKVNSSEAYAVSANDHEVCVTLSKDAVISVYDLSGRMVKMINGHEGVNLFNIDEDGVHIVAVGTVKKKILTY